MSSACMSRKRSRMRMRIRPLPGLTSLLFVQSWSYTSAWIASRNPGSVPLSRRTGFCTRRRATSAPNSNDHAEHKLDLKLLLIDHYDSFTYNLADLLAQFCIEPPTVLAADCVDSWDELLPAFYDGLILSPGPGHPNDAICDLSKECVRRNRNLPVLGVCLGHQILGDVYGAKVKLAPAPVHGQVMAVRLMPSSESDPLWNGVLSENGVNVTRYHSLQVSLSEGSKLLPTAVTDDSHEVLMAMRHEKFPHFGMQFHPESIGTNETGKQLLRNFVQVCWDHKQISSLSDSVPMSKAAFSHEKQIANPTTFVKDSLAQTAYTVYIHKVENLPPNGANMQPTDVMDELLVGQDYSFWLDEARANGLAPAVSILGASRQRVEYWGKEKPIEQQGVFVWNEENETHVDRDTDILSYLQQRHDRPSEQAAMVSFDGDTVLTENLSERALCDSLPFDYRGGHVGYLGYEVRHDTTRYLEKLESGRHHDSKSAIEQRLAASDPNVPTAAFLWADKSFVFDHQTFDWYLIGVAIKGDASHKERMLEWIRSMSARLQRGKHDIPRVTRSKHTINKTTLPGPAFAPNRSRSTYSRNFGECMEYIRQGESYELCLTNQLEAKVKVPDKAPIDLYNVLRKRNAAPFSAFFNWNACHKRQDTDSNSAVALCCSSPERFVSVKRKRQVVGRSFPLELQVEAKPIKGTTARVLPTHGRTSLTVVEQAQDSERAQGLQRSVKDRAENLMIVDLLRNDLSRVCETGSVHVAKLMDIESFATVHQMVSTIRGTLDPTKRSAVDVLRSCFPGGSMTGAPKLRTMELLDEIEEGVSRGPYSGCLGYISLNGSMDMNIVIRTAVLTPSDGNDNDEWKVRIGAGGAITALSESADEYDEMMLKASAVMGAVSEWAAKSEIIPRNKGAENATSTEELENFAT